MLFKKITPALDEASTRLNVTELTPFQKELIPKIKSGANIFGIAPDGAGKTTGLIIGIIEKLKGEPIGDNPRAIIFVKDKEAALALEEKFYPWIRYTDLRIYCVVEEHHIYNQKDLIYLGADIVIATPKRLNKLYFQNGINLNELEMLVIEDANFLNSANLLTEISRISESLTKLQHIVFATHFDPKISKMEELFMSISTTVEMD